MAKKPATALAADETLNGSNTLPALIEIAEGKSVQLGDVVRAAFEKSGLSVEAWNALAEADRDGLLNQAIEVMKLAAATNAVGNIPPLPAQTETVFAELKGVEVGHETADLSDMTVSRAVLVVSAPGGARRRAGLAFDVQPRELTEEELGATVEEVEARINALRADPKLKIDTRLVEIEE